MPALFMRLWILVVIAVAATAAVRTHAGSLSEEDTRSVERIVMAQLVAFASDDAAGAFATTTPAVRKAIGDAGRFVALVRGTYPMVYRPATVVFHKPEVNGNTVMQRVEITDDRTKSWLAMFELERQPDRSWAISGCIVSANRWLST
jgi:hypothetical protein